jgi:hypothetical protein
MLEASIRNVAIEEGQSRQARKLWEMTHSEIREIRVSEIKVCQVWNNVMVCKVSDSPVSHGTRIEIELCENGKIFKMRQMHISNTRVTQL